MFSHKHTSKNLAQVKYTYNLIVYFVIYGNEIFFGILFPLTFGQMKILTHTQKFLKESKSFEGKVESRMRLIPCHSKTWTGHDNNYATLYQFIIVLFLFSSKQFLPNRLLVRRKYDIICSHKQREKNERNERTLINNHIQTPMERTQRTIKYDSTSAISRNCEKKILEMNDK